MKLVYPVIIEKNPAPGEKYRLVRVPDLDGAVTQGESIADCIDMARDLIGITCLSLEEDFRRPAPEASDVSSLSVGEGEFVTLVDLDFDEYRRRYSTRTVRRNVTIPSNVDYLAHQANINVSAFLTAALKRELHIS